jgi:hypothetical protein
MQTGRTFPDLARGSYRGEVISDNPQALHSDWREIWSNLGHDWAREVDESQFGSLFAGQIVVRHNLTAALDSPA